MVNINWALIELSKLDPCEKFETMLRTAAVITKLLEKEGIVPIVVGGFSVELYTMENYTTRDIDFVSTNIKKSKEVIKSLGFKSEGRILYHDKLEVVVEFPDDKLAGSYDKVNRILIDKENELHINVISFEDIIMDRLRAKLYWKDIESKRWGMYMLAQYFLELDLDYMMTINKGAETNKEIEELKTWIGELETLKKQP